MLDFSQSFFELFGLPQSYRLDGGLLSTRYRDLQQALHPDRFAASGGQERRLSMQASMHVNQAYQTLRDPLLRARYLLSLLTGQEPDGQETTKDMDFLMEQMELREALGEVRNQPDPWAAVARILAELSAQAGALDGRLARLFDRPSAEDLEAAGELVRKMQILDRCRIEAERVEADLDEAG